MKNYLTTSFKSAMTTLCLLVLFGIGSNSLWGQSLKIYYDVDGDGSIDVSTENVVDGEIEDLCTQSCHIVTLVGEYCNAAGTAVPGQGGNFVWVLPDGSSVTPSLPTGELVIPVSSLTQNGSYTLTMPNFTVDEESTELIIEESIDFECPSLINVVVDAATCTANLSETLDVASLNCGPYSYTVEYTFSDDGTTTTPTAPAVLTTDADDIVLAQSFMNVGVIRYGTHDVIIKGYPNATGLGDPKPGLSCATKVHVIDGNTNVACNDELNITLDSQCEAEISPLILLEGDFCETSFIVEIDLNGNGSIGSNETGSSVTITAPGTYTVSVINPSTGISCWGTITAEDKNIPGITCPANVTVDCSSVDNIGPDAIIKSCLEINDDVDGTGASTADEVPEYPTVGSGTSLSNGVAGGTPNMPTCRTIEIDLTGYAGTISDLQLHFSATVDSIQNLSLYLISPDPDGGISGTASLDEPDTTLIADFCSITNLCPESNIDVYFRDDAIKTYNDFNNALINCRTANPAYIGAYQPARDFSNYLSGDEIAYDHPTDPDQIDIEGVWKIMVCNKGVEPIEDMLVDLQIIRCQGIVGNPENLVSGCGNNINITYSDEEDPGLGCSDALVKSITRTWTITNENSNFSNFCSQTIDVRRTNFDDIILPPHYDGNVYASLNCQELFLPSGGLNPNYVSEDTIPLPALTGAPTAKLGVLCDNFQLSYVDQRIRTCGEYGMKIIRKWTILDWCDSAIDEYNQIIKINQVSPLLVVCPDERIVDITGNDCNGDSDLSIPLFFAGPESCASDITYTVGYLHDDDADINTVPPSTDESFVMDSKVIDDNGDGIPDRITNFPVGRSWVRYFFVDECGNQGKCTTEITITDGTLPNPVCIEHLIVSVGANGCGRVPALSIDNHSYDNCGDIVKWEVKKANDSDFSYGETIEYCCGCSDPIQYANLRVTDSDGNSNSCTVEIELQNNFVPVVDSASLPTPSLRFLCTDGAVDLHAIAAEGLATFNVSSGCPMENDMFTVNARHGNGINAGQIVNPGDELVPEGCGNTSVTIKYEVVDECGNVLPINGRSSFDQNITIEYNTSSAAITITRTLPNVTILGCDSNPIPGNLASNLSLTLNDVSSSGCSRELAITWDDLVFNDVEGHCMKIVRTWTVIDWCLVNITGSIAAGTVTTDQAIYIDDESAPMITNQSDITKPASKATCEILLQQEDLTYVVSDLCTATEDIIISYKVNGVVTNNILNRNYDSGTAFTICATDLCGNTESLQFRLIGVDDVAPTPYCRDQVVTTINSNGFAEIWTADFDLGSIDNCDRDLDIYFENGQTFTRFFCEDLANGISQIISLDMFYRDDAGNVNSCIVSVFVQDNDDHCNNEGGSRITGNIHTEEAQMVSDVNVNLMNNNAPMNMVVTPGNGNYAFDAQINNDYAVVPHKDDSFLNGVSTLDLVMIQRHILGINRFDSAYKAIAADANNDGIINGIDLVTLRKLILGIITELPHGQTAWRFPIESQQFADVNKPFPFLEEINVYNLAEDMNNQNFVGVKVGDINGDVVTSLRSGDEEVAYRSNKQFTLEMDDVGMMEGIFAEVPVRAVNMNDIVGFQTTLTFNPEMMVFAGVNSAGLDIDESNLGLQNLADGYITVSWNNLEGVTISDNRVLFNLEFKINESGNLSEQLFLSSALTTSEAYTGDMETIKLNLEYKGADLSDFVLYQNIPNPFTDNTEIRFNLPAAADVTFSVFDVNGRALMNRTSNYEGGSHTITLNSQELSSTGVLYYKLETPYGTASRKMIQIK